WEQYLGTLITSSISLRRTRNFAQIQSALFQRNLLAQTSLNCHFSWCTRAHTSAQAKKPGSKKLSNHLTACSLAFQRSKHVSRLRRLRVRDHVSEAGLSSLLA